MDRLVQRLDIVLRQKPLRGKNSMSLISKNSLAYILLKVRNCEDVNSRNLPVISEFFEPHSEFL
jgi:hypothetical protein